MFMRVVSLLFLSVLLLGCSTTPEDASPGYMPIPDQFIGRWEPVSKNVWQPITIERTSTGALITADTTVSDEKGHVHPIIDKTTINIFAASQNRLYAISEERNISKKTGLDVIIKPYYVYYIIDLKPSEYLPFTKVTLDPKIALNRIHCRTKLTEKSMSIAASIHWSRMNNNSCEDIPPIQKLQAASTFYYSKMD